MMTECEMAKETDDLDRLVKERWPRGWGCLIRQNRAWTAIIYDDGLNSTLFSATTADAALQQARAHLDEHQPMTEERLASILGIECPSALTSAAAE